MLIHWSFKKIYKSDFSVINKSERFPKTCRGHRAGHSVAAPVFVSVFSLGVWGASLSLSRFLQVCVEFYEDSEQDSVGRFVAEGAGLLFGWFIIFIMAENVDFVTKYWCLHSLKVPGRQQERWSCVCVEAEPPRQQNKHTWENQLLSLPHLQININGFMWNRDNSQDVVGN